MFDTLDLLLPGKSLWVFEHHGAASALVRLRLRIELSRRRTKT